jgi:hypothetical protein
MALQMEDSQSRDVAELRRFDRMESVLAAPKAVEHVVAGGIPGVDRGTLVPVPPIELDRFVHGAH